jgi:hypothetical protein
MDKQSAELDPGSRLADAVERMAADVRRLADALQTQSRSQSHPLPREAYSIEEAAEVSGMTVASIQHLIRTRKLPYIQSGKQRGRMILAEDLRSFLKKHRQPAAEEVLGNRKQA